MKKLKNFGFVTYNKRQGQVEYSYFEKDGESWKKKFGSDPVSNEVFIPHSNAIADFRLGKETGHKKDFYGNPILVNIPCEFFDKNPPTVIKHAERRFGGDISPVVKFLAENFSFDPNKDEIPPLRTHYMDIETRVDNYGFLSAWQVGPDGKGYKRGGVNLISSYDNITDETHLFGIKPYNDTVHPIKDKITYIYCKDERTLLIEYMNYLKRTDPDNVSGWNCYGYDIPYIINRLLYHFGEKVLYKFGNGSCWINNKNERLIVRGINVIDYMILYKKFEITPRRSYSLDNITKDEGITVDGEGKHKYEGSIKTFYETDWNGFVRYCIQDSKLVFELEKKKKLIDTLIMLCYISGVSMDHAISNDVSWLRIHDASIYRFTKDRGLELPENIEHPDAEKFLGAYVKEPVAGVYDYVTVFDVASLYPSCIRALNISLETYRGQVVDGDVTKREGKFTVDFYNTLWLSLGEYEQKLINHYNSYNNKKLDPQKNIPRRYIFEDYEQFKMVLNKHNLCVAGNGAIFTKDFRGVIPSLLDEWVITRKKYKKLYLKNKELFQSTGEKKYKELAERYYTIQNVRKILLNAIYGYIGCKFSRMYNVEVAEAVTATGQLIIKEAENILEKKAEMFKNCVMSNDTLDRYTDTTLSVYIDTDSLFINYGKIFNETNYDYKNEPTKKTIKKCLKIDELVKTEINNHLNTICSDVLLCDNMFEFETEEQIERLLITSKKKYIAKVNYDKVNNQYIDDYTIKGMEFKKSNLSEPVKEFLFDIVKRIMKEANADNIIELMREEFHKMSVMPLDNISFAQSVKNLEKYKSKSNVVIDSYEDKLKGFAVFPKQCPYHVSGAIVMNNLIETIPELREMETITEGTKAKIAFVCESNAFGIKALAYTGEWHPKLYEYFKIDLAYMFQRLIMGPMKPIFNTLNWHISMDEILGFRFIGGNNQFKQIRLF